MAQRAGAATLSDVDDVRLSKLLSLVLRHDPGRIGVSLDSAGWISVPTLLAALAEHGYDVSRERLAHVVARSDKQRFVLDEGTNRIRANQGHSVPVDLGLPPSHPPTVLYHGTPVRNVESILREGLVPKGRHAVHLSADQVTAHRVGARRGAHVVLAINASAMHRDGHTFFVSANGVWLTESVPARYLRVSFAPQVDTLDMTWPRLEGPWEDLRSTDYGRDWAPVLAAELRKEMAPDHPFHSAEFEVVGKFNPTDDVLIRLGDGRWAIVHLTWPHHHPDISGVPEIEPVDAVHVQAEIDRFAADY